MCDNARYTDAVSRSDADARDMYTRVIARIRQRQSLFRLAFDDRRVTRSMLRAQAEEFERWLATLDPKP